MVWAVSLLTTKLSPRRLTHRADSLAFAVWLGVVTSTWPRAHPVLYLQGSSLTVAAPQCISGRTSYLHVRLAFHPYPQVIPQFCNTGGCEPRRTFTSASLCSWVAHVVSGRLTATCPARSRKPGTRPVQTRFPSGSPPLLGVNQATAKHSPDHSTKGTPSAPWWLVPQWPLTAGAFAGSGSLSSPLRGAFHLSLTVLVRYRSRQFFSLGGWSPRLPTGFPVSRGTQDLRLPSLGLPLRDCHPLGCGFPTASGRPGMGSMAVPSTPARSLRPLPGLGSSPFARHY
jgi:hypothetical protein